MKKKRKPIEIAGFSAACLISLAAVVLCLSDVVKTGTDTIPQVLSEEAEQLAIPAASIDYDALGQEIRENFAAEAGEDAELADALQGKEETTEAAESSSTITVRGVVDAAYYKTSIGSIKLIGVSDVFAVLDDGTSAQAIVSERLRDDAELTIEYDEVKTDSASKLLVYAYFPDGTMVQEWLLENGLVKYTPDASNVKYQDRLEKAEEKAKQNKAGLWK